MAGSVAGQILLDDAIALDPYQAQFLQGQGDPGIVLKNVVGFQPDSALSEAEGSVEVHVEEGIQALAVDCSTKMPSS